MPAPKGPEDRGLARVYSSVLLEVVMEGFPRALIDVLGRRQAVAIIERLVEKAARQGFAEVLEKLGGNSGPREPSEALAVLVPENPGRRLAFQVVSRIEHVEGKLLLSAEKHCSEGCLAVLAGITAGILTAAGFPAKSVPSPTHSLCYAAERPDYIVYYVENPEPVVVVERLVC